MPIYKAKNYIDVYRALAKESSLDKLSGRDAREYLTDYINKQIIRNMSFSPNDCVLDIGCGDGSLLKSISPSVKNGKGMVPTDDEYKKLIKAYEDEANISFSTGLAQALPFENNCFNKIVCNGVFLILENKDVASKALAEIYRVAKSGCIIWLGEVMHKSEMDEKSKYYGDSISKWLLYSLRKDRFSVFLRNLIKVVKSLAGYEVFIIQPKTPLVLSESQCRKMIEEAGFKSISSFSHKEINKVGVEYDSNTRLDFIFKK